MYYSMSVSLIGVLLEHEERVGRRMTISFKPYCCEGGKGSVVEAIEEIRDVHPQSRFWFLFLQTDNSTSFVSLERGFTKCISTPVLTKEVD